MYMLDGLMQNCGPPSASTVEVSQCSTNPSIIYKKGGTSTHFADNFILTPYLKNIIYDISK